MKGQVPKINSTVSGKQKTKIRETVEDNKRKY